MERFKFSKAFEELVNQRFDAYQKSVGEQILNRFRRKRPDIDLSFLNEFESEGVEVAELAQEVGEAGPTEGDAEQASVGGEQAPVGGGEQ